MNTDKPQTPKLPKMAYADSTTLVDVGSGLYVQFPEGEKRGKFMPLFWHKCLTTKNISTKNNVYASGIRNWEADDSHNYSLVIYRFRVIFRVAKKVYAESAGMGGES